MRYYYVAPTAELPPAAAAAPWPAPEIPCRVVALGDPEVPTGARRVAAAARVAGWVVTATYARGTCPGRPPRVVDSLALRMRHEGRRAVAVWLGAKFDCAFVWGADVALRRCNVTELRAALQETVRAL